MGRKYEFTGAEYYDGAYGVMFRQIRALRSFGSVQKGDLGGWIQERRNLSDEGNCWVGDGARVFNGAIVHGDAVVENSTLVFDDAEVFGNAIVSGPIRNGRIKILDGATVCGNAVITSSFCTISGEEAWVCGGNICDDRFINRYVCK